MVSGEAITGRWDAIEAWLLEVVARPDPRLGRSGALCPFVRRSLREGAIVYRTAPVSEEVNADDLAAAVLALAAEFDEQRWPDAPSELHALVISFPGLPPQAATLLDDAHRLCKGSVVHQGLMVAQFHPHGNVPSVRNSEVAAGTAPVPVMVLRRMAEHDILFLADDPAWTAAYLSRFGDQLLHSREADALLRSTLASALEATSTHDAR